VAAFGRNGPVMPRPPGFEGSLVRCCRLGIWDETSVCPCRCHLFASSNPHKLGDTHFNGSPLIAERPLFRVRPVAHDGSWSRRPSIFLAWSPWRRQAHVPKYFWFGACTRHQSASMFIRQVANRPTGAGRQRSTLNCQCCPTTNKMVAEHRDGDGADVEEERPRGLKG
jgi:hypothetical protein